MKKKILILFFFLILSTLFNFVQSEINTLFDPDFNLNISQFIQKHGYPVENHFATTKDGYIISLQRIPNGKKIINNNKKLKASVILQHGLEDIGTTWVIQENDYQSLGFILADEGYDVWISNVRGTRYSNKHLKYNVNDVEYWNFTFDEMSEFDLPCVVDYVINVTGNDKVNYIGHSQGTTMGFIGFKEGSELTKKINTFFALAPVTRVTHCKSVLLNLISQLSIGEIVNLVGIKSFPMDIQPLRVLLLPSVCSITPFACTTSLRLLFGSDDGDDGDFSSNLNQTRLPIILSQSPGGTSTKNMIHWSQNFKKGFQKFDYGSSHENFIHYSQSTPPKYNITNFSKTIPTFLFTGGNDTIN
ncbi:hypothetical protein DDB_G0268964 [Dictyostelium discoideum AX4]|uniref:Partial AB-hydrolase lipase domain-containing protein n=1 Tax=Dictyostelium discoideum TaxID=44689 RepID=Q55EU9_DICDI|nr:hypothetical protein DDB_G0268964 [Dictyostelium discoideum AX4]EAL73071.1 hypothetical protein DDB_G0268964 [Dictyostelium discoideum AX4]|eukprot:XP_646921.1 hypothetical protein DDB_G0268964 [Dictyostelium discoideum AX4]